MKTKKNTQENKPNSKIRLEPFIIAVEDYHEFDDIIFHFESAGISDLHFIEVGYKSLRYHAVFYQGKRTKEVDTLAENFE